MSTKNPEKTFYITTPIYYVNDKPHIGHCYTTLCADVMARFYRLIGHDVFFLTGTDEHGQKIQKAAEAASLSPQEFTDQVSKTFVSLNEHFCFSPDYFIRTTDKAHKEFVVRIWQKLYDNGYIYLDKYAGWYSVRDEAFYLEADLIDGKAPTGAPVEWIEEESYFFKLSAFQDKLLELYESNPDFIKPKGARNEVISFVKGGLKDLSVSRTSFNWGIKVPGDEEHVIYVWLDALFNYVSAIENDEKRKYWPCDVHLVGKDILKFHAIYWPAFLMAVDMELPKTIFAHGWWTNEGQKISKSLGNTIDPMELANEFGVDLVRYFLVKEGILGNDANYSHYAFAQRINGELVNNVGNLIQRVMYFVYANCLGVIPKSATDFDDMDRELLFAIIDMPNNALEEIKEYRLHGYIDLILNLSRKANEYISLHHPFWEEHKLNKDRMSTTLFVLVEVIRAIGIGLLPIMPYSANKILDQVCAPADHRTFSHITLEHANGGQRMFGDPEYIFQRIKITSADFT